MKRRWKWLLAGLCLVLLLSLLANLWIGLEARHLYAQMLIEKIWPAEMTAAPRPPTEPMTNVLLFLGDSRITDWGEPALPGCQTVNAGMTGASSAEVRLRTAALCAQFHPRAVVVEAGINDLKLLGLRPDLSDAVVGECIKNLRAIASEAARSGAHVFLCEVWPPGPPGGLRRFVWNAAIPAAVTEVNRQLASPANLPPGVRVVDFFPDGIRAEWRRDPLHLKPEAYRSATENLQKLMSGKAMSPSAPP
jgi:lysophospholipase L1-like esterase